MTHLTKAVLVLLATVAVAGCTRGDRFGNMSDSSSASQTAAIQPGSASDPASPLYFQQSVGDRVLFEVDQSTLTETARITLNGQVTWLSTNTDYNAVIEGHADEQGTREYNLALGARRANAVREYLIANGVAGARLRTVSYGKERPIEICSEEACYAKNRRAVTTLSAGAGTS